MKKLLSLILCAIMLFSALIIPSAAAQYNPETLDEDNLSLNQTIMRDETFILGDADGDGEPNGKDALSIKANIAGLEGYVMNAEACDFNGDGAVDAKDSYLMKTCLSGTNSFDALDGKYQIYSLTVGGIAIDEYCLVIPEDTVYDSNLYFATELLYEYIKDSTGVALNIVRGEAEDDHGIYLHHVADDTDLGRELGHEGYKYEISEGNLHIYGTHRGCMYAAYELIEDFLGYGFLNGSATFLYKQRTVDISEGLEKTYIPTYRFRHTKSSLGGSGREHSYLARRLNGSQSYGYKNEKRSLEYYGDFVGPVFNNIHSYAYYWQMATGTMPADDGTMTLEERYYAKLQSGEAKDETKWEPCATLEKDYNKLFSGFLDTIRMIEARGYPIKYQDGTNCYSFSANDNSNWCSCRNCKKASNEKTYTGVYLELANRGARDIQEYYPGLKIFTWIYTRETPTNVLPDENVIVVLAGFNCANHHLGSDACVGDTFFNHNNKDFEGVIDAWDIMCQQSGGAEIWLWYYPETHFFWLYDLPNIYTIYYDMVWFNEHGISGMFYEGSGGRGYWFEAMKAYLASCVMFDTSITLEEYDQLIKDYLYMAYGRGWEYMYEFIQMFEAAGDAVGCETGGDPYCFIGNYDRAYDMVSVVYLNENYETMRNLLLAAIEANDESLTTNSGSRITKLENLFNCFEILGLGATYLDSYVNGTDEQRAEYEARYTAFLDYYHSHGMTVSSYDEHNSAVPNTVDLEKQNPAYYFYPGGSRRASVNALLGGEAD